MLMKYHELWPEKVLQGCVQGLIIRRWWVTTRAPRIDVLMFMHRRASIVSAQDPRRGLPGGQAVPWLVKLRLLLVFDLDDR